MKKIITRLNKYYMELPFKVLYLIFAFLSFCNLTYGQPIMSVVVDLVLLVGAITILCRLIKIQGYLRTKGLIFLVLFCISYIISLIANYRYGISDNLKYLVWTGFHLFVFYMCDTERDVKDYKREFDIISWVFIASSFALVFTSLLMYYMKISIVEYEHQGGVLLAGIVWGRLWGTFQDPNYGSVFATLAIVFSYYKIVNIKRKSTKIFLSLNIVCDLLYIALSDSRTGIVCLFSCTFLYVFLLKIKEKKNKYISIIITTLIFSIGMATVPVLIKNVNNSVVSFEETVTEDKNEELTIGREEDLEGNFSNRRTDLWVSALEIFKKKPVIGTSFFNLVPYTKENLPETYLVNNDLGTFNNFHNMPFNLLVGQGVLGLGIMIVFGITTIIYIFKNLMKSEGDVYEYQVVLITGVVASLECSMFVTDILYTNSPMAVIFWMLLGYLVHYTKWLKESKEREKKFGKGNER